MMTNEETLAFSIPVTELELSASVLTNSNIKTSANGDMEFIMQC